MQLWGRDTDVIDSKFEEKVDFSTENMDTIGARL